MSIDQNFKEEGAKEIDPDDPAQNPRQGLPASVQVVAPKKGESLPPVPLDNSNSSSKGPWIQYNGIGTLRIMDPAAWKDAGVNSQKNIQWNYLNKMRVPRSAFTDEELQYLLRVDGRFSLESE